MKVEKSTFYPPDVVFLRSICKLKFSMREIKESLRSTFNSFKAIVLDWTCVPTIGLVFERCTCFLENNTG